MSETKQPLTRTEENVKYEEQKRKVKELMRRDGERQDWDNWRSVMGARQPPFLCV